MGMTLGRRHGNGNDVGAACTAMGMTTGMTLGTACIQDHRNGTARLQGMCEQALDAGGCPLGGQRTASGIVVSVPVRVFRPVPTVQLDVVAEAFVTRA